MMNGEVLIQLDLMREFSMMTEIFRYLIEIKEICNHLNVKFALNFRLKVLA